MTQPEQQNVVYTRKVVLPSKAFPQITREKLAINNISTDGEDGFFRLDFELLNGDIIQVVRGSRPIAAAPPDPTYDELVAFARFTQKFWKEGQEIMRKHNLCIDNLDDNMQKLAFTFYSNLCEIDSEARHLFKESYGEENYNDERLPAGVTYSPDHDATIRREAYEQGKRDALLEKDNLHVSTLVGYDEGYKVGAREERERVIDLLLPIFAEDNRSPFEGEDCPNCDRTIRAYLESLRSSKEK